ncbi:MAG: hypothetical protein JWO38_6725 [Gemmataceae bacterium]|nr:hypothetical protein [Gemmataceae bacterium]
MTDQDDDRPRATPVRRVPGKYIVYGMAVFGALFLGFMILLALRLSPAADRFHNQPAATRPR